jgi:putative MFS transporter
MAVYRSVSDAIDAGVSSRRYWGFASVVAVCTIFEYFDLFLIGYVLSIVGPEWGLSFGQVAIVLLSSGVGALAGALAAGWAGHKFGRKPTMLITLVACGAGTGLMAFVPEGSWQSLAALRFLIGAAVPALHLAVITLVVELTPTRRRTMLSSLIAIAFVPLGGVSAALAASSSDSIGWRGLVLLGWAGVLLVPVILALVPESPRWLADVGRHGRAEEVLRRFTRDDAAALALASDAPDQSRGRFADLFRNPTSVWLTVLTWFGISTVTYGMVLWGPTLLTLLLNIEPAQAASLFILVSLGGLAGRMTSSFAAGRFGRRATGMVLGFGSAVALIAVALLGQQAIGGVALFLPLLILAYFMSDGGWANAGPMPSELFPTALRTRAGGLAQAVNGLGKILGPMVLGLIAGTGNLLTPQATVDALTPAFLCLAGFSLLVGITFAVTPIETRGRSLDQLGALTPGLDEPGASETATSAAPTSRVGD